MQITHLSYTDVLSICAAIIFAGGDSNEGTAGYSAESAVEEASKIIEEARRVTGVITKDSTPSDSPVAR